MIVPTFRQVSNGMYGAWRLARFDASAMVWFDRSEEGVWRSFWAAALTYPGFIILLALRVAPEEWISSGAVRILLVESIGYVIAWTAFPLAILPLCRWLEREEQCFDFITAYNWSQVLQTWLFLAVKGLIAMGLVPAAIAVFVEFAAVIGILAYEWFIARTALEAGGIAATVIVLFDIVLGEAIARLTQGLY